MKDVPNNLLPSRGLAGAAHKSNETSVSVSFSRPPNLTPSARNIYALSLGDAFQPVAAPVKLSKPGSFSRPAWTADGRDLVFSENDNSIVDNLWRLKATEGAVPSLVVSDVGIAPAISRQVLGVRPDRFDHQVELPALLTLPAMQ